MHFVNGELTLPVFIFYCCRNESAKIQWYERTQMYLLQVWRSEVPSQSLWAKVKVLAGPVPSGNPWGEPVSLLFWLLEATCVPWLVTLPHITATLLLLSEPPTSCLSSCLPLTQVLVIADGPG